MCEISNKKTVNIPKAALPDNVSEGDVILVEIDKTQTVKRKEKIDKLMNDLFVD